MCSHFLDVSKGLIAIVVTLYSNANNNKCIMIITQAELDNTDQLT